MTTHNDDGSIIEEVVLSQESGNYGANIPINVWHKLESLEENSVIFECKEGPFVEQEVEGILEVKSEKLKSIMTGISKDTMGISEQSSSPTNYTLIFKN